ncbi:MAG: hypothetical protein PHU85_09280 [Phycisphaerae bacterium]|nr:hypothetical protein [Phycisphaerae bacterium]
MNIRMTIPLTVAAAVLLIGCAGEKKTLLFDAAHPLKSMPHVKIVGDPFAASRPDAPAPLVLKGGPLGPEEAYQNKGTFPADHFVMPTSGRADLVVVVAMKKLTDLKVEVWGKNPDGKSDGMKFRKTLPAVDGWQTVTVPIDATKVKPGAAVYDITIFQVGKDKDARLFIKGVWVVKK